jgi:ABC-type multidrug transport system ATPase subunit
VDRETTLIGSLTVREFLYYSALLQLPGFFCQKKSVVEDAIHAMSLGEHANKLIGGHCYMKGLPSGERRLVSIARELVMRPRILFLDEPLYHLDRYLFYFSIHFSVIIVYFVLEIIPFIEQFSLTSFSLFIYF